MRVVVTGGGTGGHLYPALAVVEALKQDSDILYIGNLHKKEAELVPQAGVRFEGILFSGMPRKPSLALVKWFFSLFMAVKQSLDLLKQFKPDVVLGTGGYVTAPVLLAAKLKGIPFVVHEPDALPGIVNRVMSRWAAAATCAFQCALKTDHLVVTGNPLRGSIGTTSKEAALQNLGVRFDLSKPVLLVVGGSQGAQQVNKAVLSVLPRLLEDFQIIHQTGEKLYEEVLSQCPPAYRNHPSYLVLPFIADMASALALADISLCRSGSMSLSEMLRAHVPMILVPYPYAAQDHQKKNALAMVQAGVAVMIEDKDLTGDSLVSVLQDLQTQPEVLVKMKEACVSLAKPNATEEVVAVLKSFVLK
jgi:UDP-N-acetylglucosamine--N-acetylmuramyl-(pentapeptide) pyrophosphoryl-undecaprenol N-acetylglucosamine transferase